MDLCKRRVGSKSARLWQGGCDRSTPLQPGARFGAEQALMHRAYYAAVDSCLDLHEGRARRGGWSRAIEDEDDLIVSMFFSRVWSHQAQPYGSIGTLEGQMDCPPLRQKLGEARPSRHFHKSVRKRGWSRNQRREFDQGSQSVHQIGGRPDRFQFWIDPSWDDVLKTGQLLRRGLCVGWGRGTIKSKHKVGCINRSHVGRAATPLGGSNQPRLAYLTGDMIDAATRAPVSGGKCIDKSRKARHVSLPQINHISYSDHYAKSDSFVYGVFKQGALYD